MKTGRPKTGGGSSGGASIANRLQARAAITAYNAERHLRPKCGAKTRTTGAPCQDVAMENGRCFRHGGRVPKGKNWHRPVWPNRDAPDLEPKLASKLKALAKRKKAKAERLARRTPEERAAHQAWQRSHKPGEPKARARDRERRRQDIEARKVLFPEPAPETAVTIADRGNAAPRTADFQQLRGPGAFG